MTAIVLALVILFLAAAQPSTTRMVAAYSYAIVNLGFLFAVAWWADGYWYYIAAAGADLLIMALLLQAPRISDTAISLMRVCLVEIVINASGWIMWYNYQEPALYNTLFHCVNAWVVWILIKRDKADELGGRQVDRRTDWVRFVLGSGGPTLPSRGA